MKTKSKQLSLFLTSLIIIIILFVMGWLNSFLSDQFTKESNFLRPWSAIKSFIEYGIDPYGDQVTNKSQILIYGELVESDTNPQILDQTFASVILYFPFALIKDYAIARVIYLMILELALIAIPLLCISLWEWKPPWSILFLFVLFSTLAPSFVVSLLELDPVIFIVFFTLIGLICMKKGFDEFAGASFAIAILQPSVTGLLMIFVLLWIIRFKRWRVFWGWFMMIGLLLLISLALLPDWIPSFIKAFRVQSAYNGYFTIKSILSEIYPGIGGKLAIALTSISIIILLYEWINMKFSDFRWVMWTLVLTICIYSLIGLPVLRNSLDILIIPLSYFIVGLAKRFMPGRNWVIPVIGFIMIFIFGWGAFILGNKKDNIELMNFLIYILFPIILTFGLYSIRWWSIKYPKSRLLSSD